MWRFGIGAAPPKKQKLDSTEKKESDKLYEINKRQRTFIQSWTSGRPWLRYEKASNTMFCDMCIKYDVTSKHRINKDSSNKSTFVTGCQTMKLHYIKVFQ